MTTVTPEARERQARSEVGVTTVAPGVTLLLCVGFVAVIALGLGWQLALDMRDQPEEWPRTVDPVRVLPVWEEVRGFASDEGWVRALTVANQRLLTNIEDYELDLEERAPLIEALVPSVNLLVTDLLRGSTESVYPGRRGWLFFRPDVEYVTGRGFLDPAILDARLAADPAQTPDPLLAIVELRDALSRRGSELLVVPAPVKPTIYPEAYSKRYEDRDGAIQNPSFATFLQRLDEVDIAYVDLAASLSEAKAGGAEPLFLRTDTHWTPAGMLVAADAIAVAVETLALEWEQPPAEFTSSQVEVRNLGDTMALLRPREEFAAGRMEVVTVDQVSTSGGQPWVADANAEILFLGDSFANIYSLPTLGWGSAAGLVEHVSASLGRSVDVLNLNDNGSYGTRLMLAGQIRQGRDRLAGKKVVVYEFASRELAFGDWRTGLPY